VTCSDGAYRGQPRMAAPEMRDSKKPSVLCLRNPPRPSEMGGRQAAATSCNRRLAVFAILAINREGEPDILVIVVQRARRGLSIAPMPDRAMSLFFWKINAIVPSDRGIGAVAARTLCPAAWAIIRGAPGCAGCRHRPADATSHPIRGAGVPIQGRQTRTATVAPSWSRGAPRVSRSFGPRRFVQLAVLSWVWAMAGEPPAMVRRHRDARTSESAACSFPAPPAHSRIVCPSDEFLMPSRYREAAT